MEEAMSGGVRSSEPLSGLGLELDEGDDNQHVPKVSSAKKEPSEKEITEEEPVADPDPPVFEEVSVHLAVLIAASPLSVCFGTT